MFDKNMLIAAVTVISLMSGTAYAKENQNPNPSFMVASNSYYGDGYSGNSDYYRNYYRGNNSYANDSSEYNRYYGYKKHKSNRYYSNYYNRNYSNSYSKNRYYSRSNSNSPSWFQSSRGYYYGKYNNNNSRYGANAQYAARRTFSYASKGPVSSRGTVIFDPKQLSWAAYDASGSLVKTGAASGGSNYCRDVHHRCHTPVGSFRVFAKGGANCKSSKFPLEHPGAPMPYCMKFHGGYALHGSYEVRPYNASHGCIRILPEDARWLSQNLVRPGTRVIVRPY